MPRSDYPARLDMKRYELPESSTAADDDGNDGYGNPLYGAVRPGVLHDAAMAAKGGARLMRYARLMMGSPVGAGGGGVGALGNGLRGVNYARNITNTPADFIGPSVAPTAMQSIRGGVNSVGIRGGVAVAEIGLSALAETTGAMAAEDTAANGVAGSDSGANAGAYAKAMQAEYGGLRGGARYYANKGWSTLGVGEDPDQQMGELGAAVEADRQSQQQVATAQRAGRIIEHVRDQQQHDDAAQTERAAEASAGSTEERDRLRSSFRATTTTEADTKRYDAEEAAISAETPGSHSDPKYRARIAEVEQRRKASADAVRKAEAAEQAQQDKQRDERVDTLTSEAEADRQELSGDTQGAARSRLDTKLKREQEAADQRSPEEGQAFKAVADAERADLAQKQNQERVELKERTSDKVNDEQVKAQEATLKASGDIYAADTLAFEHAQDEKIAKLRQLQDATVDTAKKSAIGQEIDAAEKANRTERAARDAGHAREDTEAADDVRAGTAAEALRAGGRGAEADELTRLTRDNDEIRRATREGRPEDVKALREQRDFDRQNGEMRRDREQLGRDRIERDAGLRGNGQGALAEYQDFRDGLADDIRQAQASGDPARVAQAKRTAAAQEKAWQAEHRGPAELMGEDAYDDKLLTADWNSKGEALARAANAKDIKDLNGGAGTLKPGDAGSAKLDRSADRLGAVAGLWENALKNAVKIALAE